MNEPLEHVAGAHPAASLRMRKKLQAAMDLALPQSPGQFGERLIKEKWGQGIDPQTAILVTLDYNFKGHPAQDGVEQGQVASARSLLQALLCNYQTVGDGRFAETAFGLYTGRLSGQRCVSSITSTNSPITAAATTTRMKAFIAKPHRKRMDR